jgi:hypothetical protein
MAAKAMSAERAIEIQGVDDIDGEKENILDFWEELEKRLAKVQAEFAPPPQPFGQSKGGTTQQKSTTAKATAKKSTE